MEKLKNLTKKKVIAIVAAVLLVVGGAIAAIAIGFGDAQRIPTEDKYGYVNPDETKAEPDDGFTIDGVLDEEEYANCDWLKLQNNQGGAGVDMAMTSFYGEKGLYIVYDITENSPIYVNLDRESYMNSGIEMYLALSDVADMNSNSIFEIDLLPTGDMNFRQRTGKDNWVNVASSDDIMAYLGATTKGGPVNTEECNGYVLELFIPWEYMDKLGMDVSQMKENFIYINPVHITSYNLTGTESGTDRYWYSFATQLGGDGWNDVAQYFRFGADGVLGTVPVELIPGANYTISGNDSVIPGMMSTVQITPDDGYTLNSILVNGEEYIKKVSYNKDGSVTLTLRGEKEGLKISASAEVVTDGNKTLSGMVAVHKLGGDSLEGVSVSYKGPTGEKPITFDKNGKFEISNLKPGYYTITVEKKGYTPINRGIYLYRDIETDLTLEYEMFKSETGYNWILDDQNDGVLNRFGGSGKILSVDSYQKFKVEANFKYDTQLAEVTSGNTFVQQRSGIQIKFSNGKYWRVNLMKENGVYKVQYAKHNDATVFNWKTVHELTEEEIALYQSANGITLSIMREGNYAWVCLNGKPVAIEILDEEYKNCTAQIGFEGWIANQQIEEMTYNISSNFNQNLKDFYVTTSDKWDISGQHDGQLLLPDGGTHFLKFQNKYSDFDFTLKNVKENDRTGNKPGRTDILLEFDTNGDGKNDKSISFGILCTDITTNTCWIQTLGNADNYIPETRIKGLYKLNASETEKYLSGEGVELRVVRKGTEVYVFLDEQEVAIWDLTQNNSGVTANTKAQLSIRHYDAEGDVELGFALSEDVGKIEINKIFKDNEKWDLSKQSEGIVALPGGGTDTSLQFFKKYQNIDLTITAKENDTTGKKPGRTDILFEFDLNNDGTMDKNVSFGIVQMSDGSCQVQTLGWDQKFIPEKRINTLYELDYAETLKYKKDGINLRVVRYETTAYIYIEDKQVAVFDLAQNNSGVKADTKATVILRHYDAVADNVEIPFKVTEAVEKPAIVKLPDAIFKNNYKWDLSKQLDGIIALPEGGDGGKLAFVNSYKNLDLKLNVRDYDDEGKTAARTDVLFVFENGAHVSFGVTSDEERAWIQSMNNGPDDDKQIYNRWSGHGNMTAEELEKYKADGVELRIVRVGTDVALYINGRFVKTADLTNNNSGVTADMLATIYIRHYDDKGEYVEIPYSITEQIELVTITDNSQIGNVSTDREFYLVGDTVVISSGAEGYYLSSLKIDGEKVALNENGTYTFKATKNSYEVEADFIKAVFVDNPNWDLTEQHQGTEEVNYTSAIKGVVTLPNGGNAYNTSNLGGLKFKDQYTDIDLNLIVRDYDDSAYTYARTDVLFEFEGGETVTFGVTKTGDANDKPNWTYRVQSMGCTLNNWKTLKHMSDDEIALYTGDSGIGFRILRSGTKFYVYLDGKLAKAYDFAGKITKDTKATVTIRHYEDAGVQVDIPFTVADEVGNIFTTQGAWGGTWDISNQFGGTVSVQATGNTGINFANKYTDMDLSLKVKENGTSSKPGRTDVLLEFENGKNVSFGVLRTNTGYFVQSLNKANDASNAGKIIFNRGTGFYQLTAEEAAKYDGDGLDFRIIRQGTVVYLFIDGRQVAECDLTTNDSGVTADMEATVTLRHYDVSGTIQFPFAISDVVEEARVTIESNEYGTITKNQVYRNGNRTTLYDITKHFVGEKIALTMTSVQGYALTGLEVNNVSVIQNVSTGDSISTYVMEAKKAANTVAGYFDTIPVFKNNYNNTIWDVSKQSEGIVSLPNGGGGTNNPLQFFKTFGDVKATLTVRDYPYAGTANEDARTELGFEFANGETVQFGVVKTGGLYRIQTRAGSLLNWKTPYFIEDQSMIDSYVVTQEELNQGNPGGLEFSVVRKGTEFYLYLGDEMVKGYDFSYKISADTKVNVFIRHYDDQGGKVEIPFAITENFTIAEEDIRLFAEKEAVTNYAYTFAVIPDPQIVTQNDVTKSETYLTKMFDWIIANKDSKNIQYVFNLGDTTQNNNDAEWTLAAAQHARLTQAGIAYSVVRGNHDLAWYGKTEGAEDYYDDEYTAYMGTDAYRAQFGGFYSEDNISNSWRTFEVGSVKYLMITMDYGPSDAVLNWASDVIEQHPAHNVIITTHAYLYRDGTTLDDGDNVPPSTSGGYNDGDDIWEKLVSKHENIVLVLSGHDPSENIIVNKSTGDNGNVVTSMLIDAQDVEKDEGSMAMVALLHFSADGKNIQVEYYSTAKEKYFKSENQFSEELDTIEKIPIFKTNYNAGIWDVSKQFEGIVSLPNGGGATNKALQFYNKYTDIDLNLIVRDYNDSANTYARTDVYFEFEGGETVTFGVTKTGDANDKPNWTYRVQSMGCTLNSWKTLKHMSDDEIALYTSDSGINFRILRNGTKFYVYLDGKLAKAYDFAGKITEDTKATVSLRHYEDAGVQVDIPFTVSDEVKDIFTTQGSWGGTWDISNQFGGTVSVQATGNAGINFANKYTDMDLSLKVKENGTSNKAGRTDVLLEFENGKNVSFGVLCTDKANGKYFIQTLNKANDASNAGKIIFNRGTGIYQLTAEEAAKYEGDGLDFRIIRQGTVVYFFIDGRQVAECDLTRNNSGVTADMEATVTLRHYDVTGNIQFPFAISDTVKEATVSIAPSANGTITKNQVYRNGDRTALYDITKHFAGEKVVLTMKPNKGYDLTGFIVNNISVAEDVETNVDGTLTYAFEAQSDNNVIETYFDVHRIFVDNYDTDLWDITAQYDGIVSLPNGGGATAKPLQFYGQFTDIDLTINARDYADVATSARTDVEFTFDVDGDGVINTANGDQTVTFGVINDSGTYKVQTRGGTLLNWKTPYELTSEEKAQFVISEEEIASGDIDGLDLRLVRSGTTMYIFVEGKQVAFCDLTKCANSNGDTASNVTADTKMFVYLRHYDDARAGGVEIPFKLNKVVNPVDVTINSNDKGSVTTNKVNYYVNNGRTSKYSDTHFMSETIVLTATPIKGTEFGQLIVDNVDVTEQVVVNPNGTATYTFVTTKDNHEVTATFEQIKIFVDNYDSTLWDITDQYDGIVSLPNGGGATAKPLQFYGQFTDIDLTINARDYADVATSARTDVEFTFDVDGDGVINTTNGDQTVTFGVINDSGTYKVQTRGGTLLNWKTPYELTSEEKAQFVISEEEIASGEIDGLDLRLVRSGTTMYIFVEGKQVAFCDLTKCANSNGDTASNVTADTEMFVYLRHYDDARAGGVEIPFELNKVVNPVDVTITTNDKGSVTTNKVNYYINNGRTSKYSDTHFNNEVITLTMTPISEEYECSKVLVNGTDVTENITVNANGTATYTMNTSETACTVEVEFTRIPIFMTNYNASLWDVSKQFEGIVSLPNGGGATASPLQFNKTYEDVKATLTVRDYPYAGTDDADARTEIGFEFANGETVQFGVVKTGGLYRIQTRAGSLLSWKTPYYIQDQSMIDSYVVTQEELSQGNPGGLEFSVVRKGTEFYLYLGDEMVKGYDFSYKIASDTKVNVFLRHYDDVGGEIEIPFTITEDFTIDEEDVRLFAEKTEVTDYAYTFAVIPDPQVVTENDVTKGQTYLTKMFDWIIANKDSKKIQYVFNLGDITQNNNDAEWTLAAEQHARLTEAGIAYSAVRGNHDLSWYGKTEGAEDYYDDEYTAYMGTDAYRAQFGGFYSEDNISNSWRTFEVGSVKYLMITMDYGPSDAVLNWASDIIYQHPDHNVIITTHAYLYRDGTTLDAEDNTPPSTTGGKNDGDDMWEKLVSKHENIVLVMSGHDPSENIIVNKSTGDNGNVVTSMLIDAQDAEKDEGSMAMVALLHFSEDGKNIQVEYYSTAKEKYFKSQNQFSTTLDVVEEGEVVYGTGYVPVSGQTVKTSSEYASFPRTIEVTFNRNSSSARQILFGNCDGVTTDYFNIEIPANQDFIYLNTKLGGTAFGHSFTDVTIPENETVRMTLVIEDAAIKLYINGEIAQTRTNANNSGPTVDAMTAKIPSANLPDSFAVGNDLRSYYFDGAIYDVTVWSDARTAEEVAGTTILDINTDSYKADLLAAYNFRAVYNANAVNPFHTDLSGNGYDLTGTLNVGTSTIAPVGAYTTVSVEKGHTYSTTISDEQRVTLTDTPYTLSTWIHVPTSVTSAAGVILGNYSGSYANALNFEISTNGNPRLYHRNASNAYDSLVFTDVDVSSDTEWVHLAFTISGNKVSCYVNGELKQTLTATNTIQLESTNKDFVIGGDLRSGNTRAFLGRILSLDLYDAILSEDKIKRLYMEGREAISEGKLIY